MHVRLAACLSLLFAAGCFLAQRTTGTLLDPEPVAAIVAGRSTRADVTRLLGPPDEIVYSNRAHDPLFEQAYRYRREKRRQSSLFLFLFSTFRSDTKFDHVVVFFDEHGVVEHVGARLDSDRAEYGPPW